MFVLVGLGLIGTFLIQVPQTIAADASEYAQWLQTVAQPVLGSWTTLINILGLFDVFHSVWFLGAGFLLVINIFICSLNRWIRSSRATASNKIVQSDSFYVSGTNNIELPDINKSSTISADILAGALKKRGYSTRTIIENKDVYLAADKNRYMQFGTYFSHLSIILLIVGFIVSSSTGFRNSDLVVSENQTVQVGYNTGLSLHLNSFKDTYWDDGTPKDYASDVIVYENGSPVKQGVVRVNHPLDYNGVRFFQSFFGPTVSLQVTDNDSKSIYAGVLPLDSTVKGMDMSRPAGYLNLQQIGLSVYIIAPGSGGQDTVLGQNQIDLEIYSSSSSNGPLASSTLELNTTKSLAGYQFTYLQSAKFSGFQVSKDPGVTLIWIASGLFIVSLCLVLYFPRRRVWALLKAQDDNSTIVKLRYESKRFTDTAAEADEMVKEVQSRL